MTPSKLLAVRSVHALLALVALAAATSAQLDLPDSSEPGSRTRSRGVKALDLPEPPPAPTPAERAEPAAPKPPASAFEAADRVFAAFAELEDADAADAVRAADDLAALGEAGLVRSRLALREPSVRALRVGMRTLLAEGSDADRDAIVERLRERLPSGAAEPALDLLFELDPVRASMELLIGLLDHPQGSMRAAASDRLAARLTAEHLPALERVLASPRADSRRRALELASRLDDPAVLRLCYAHLGDENARVAARAVRTLAVSPEPGVDAALLERASSRPVILREGAYALLAIAEREDLQGRAILGDEHAPALLAGLETGNELSTGACAVALAGIGFRSQVPRETGWLDLVVPHHLVRAVSGATFHRDFSSLQVPAQRRLALISGKSFGSNGPAWQAWWREAAGSFRARRAFLVVGPLEYGTLRLRYRASLEDESFVLAGPDAASAPATELRALEAFYLTSEECGDLIKVLDREGVLGPERLPSADAADRGRARRLELSVAGQGKAFSSDLAFAEPWFERVVDLARSLRARNRWQRYVDRTRFADRRSMWEAERAWWLATTDQEARDARLKTLVFAALESAPEDDELRREGIAELERLYATAGGADATDFGRLLALLEDEPFFGPRAHAVAAMAVAAGRLASPRTEGERAADGGVPLSDGIADELFAAILAIEGERSDEAVLDVLSACGPGALYARTADERAAIRAGAASALASDGSARGEELLLDLLDDPDARVEAAAVAALGARGSEAARGDVLLRARTSEAVVRVAALTALARMGDRAATDVMVAALTDGDPRVRIAAAQGIAELRDPATAPILMSMLERGRQSPLFEPARDGLLALGAAANDELLRVVHSPDDELAREASLILAAQGRPEVVSTLISILTDDPSDPRVAWELAVLTGVDYRGHDRPADAWWDWWDFVVHDDSLAWLVAAAERLDVRSPGRDALAGEGTRRGALYLVRVAEVGGEHLIERARRELQRLLGAPLEPAPRHPDELARWLDDLRARVDARYPD